MFSLRKPQASKYKTSPPSISFDFTIKTFHIKNILAKIGNGCNFNTLKESQPKIKREVNAKTYVKLRSFLKNSNILMFRSLLPN